MHRLVAAILALALTGAKADVVSREPDAVSVTLYDGGTYGSLSGLSIWSSRYFGFISETRIVDLPAGRTTIRFRGVASSLVPDSVRVEGLPDGSVERNFDYNLLSPGSLLKNSIGRTVHLVRTDPRTGKETREDAVVRATSQGTILDAGGRIEALHCGGPPERLEFDEVPAGLTDAPTYAITANVASPGRYTIKLTYIAMGMGWSANYVAHLHRDGRTLDLAGWVTLANVSDTSFRNAPVDVVAGRLNDDGGGSALWIDTSMRQPDCWPMDDWPHMLWLEALLSGRMRGSQVGVYSSSPVTAVTNAFDARALGDYKLYTLPERTTVAAHQTKQVRFVDRRDVPFERVYGALMALDPEQPADADEPVAVEYRVRNDAKNGLGLPLPLGTVAVLDGDGRFIGEEAMADDAPVGSPLAVDTGAALNVFLHRRLVERRKLGSGKDARTRDTVEIALRNAKPFAIPFMLYQDFRYNSDAAISAEDRPHTMDRGRPMWRFDLAPGENASLRYTVEYSER